MAAPWSRLSILPRTTFLRARPRLIAYRRSFCNSKSAETKTQREIVKEIASKKRKATAAAEALSTSETSTSGNPLVFGLKFGFAVGSVGGLLWMSFTESGNAFANQYIVSKESTIGRTFLAAQALVMTPFSDFTQPSREKLLPDMPPIPEGHVPFRTLVLDLEGTLCHSEWDRKHGWRAAKRPGLDKFLERMVRMYEIVIFSSSTFMNHSMLTQQMDPHKCVAHYLYRDSTLYQDGKYIKDLRSINRNAARFIVIEDEPEEVEFTRENVVRIKSFQDPHSPDNELEKLGDFLEDIFRRDVQDVRSEIAGYGDNYVLDEFEKRSREVKRRQEEQMRRGLGGFIRRQR